MYLHTLVFPNLCRRPLTVDLKLFLLPFFNRFRFLQEREYKRREHARKEIQLACKQSNELIQCIAKQLHALGLIVAKVSK